MIEPQPIDENSIQFWERRAIDEIANMLALSPSFEYSGERVVSAMHDSSAECTPEQVEAVARSFAMTSIRALLRAAKAQNGPDGAGAALDAATRFFGASGMIYRLRVTEMERLHRLEKKKKKLSLDSVPAVFPSHIALWISPTINASARGEGRNSMEGTEREELIEAAADFYRSGIRCVWFEKVIIEALVCAELYATIKAGKTQPTVWTQKSAFTRIVLATWAYDKSRGGEPLYSTLMWTGNLGILAVSIIVWAYLTWQAYFNYTSTQETRLLNRNLLWLVLLGAIGVAAVGKWVVQRIARWVKPASGSSSFLRENPFGRALSALAVAHKDVMAPDMSTTAARDTIRRAFAENAFVDYVVVAYLDRAIHSGEFLWSTRIN